MDKKYTVSFFEKEEGVFPAEEFINSLETKMSAKMYRTLEMLEQNGPELRAPYSKHLDDGIFEVRAKVASNITRVLYFFYVDKHIIATHGFVKKTQKTPPGEIDRAKLCRNTFLEREERKKNANT
jgi:phage-related protein